MNRVLSMVKPHTDESDLVADLKVSVSELCEKMNAAEKSGIALNFQISKGSSGKFFVEKLEVTKVL